MPVGAEPTRVELCTTAGALHSRSGGGFEVRSGMMRATVAALARDEAALSFSYAGPSRETVPLANGEVRRQIGLKLRAQDTCNVVYVMWPVAPSTGIFVSVKSNPTLSTHAACGDTGYIPVTGTWSRAVPAVDVGERHTLHASITGDALRVVADASAVWEGVLPAAARDIHGPPGVRSDNGRFDFDLKVRIDDGELAEAVTCAPRDAAAHRAYP